MGSFRLRRFIAVLAALLTLAVVFSSVPVDEVVPMVEPPKTSEVASPTTAILEKILIKGRAPKTGYSRNQFGDGWESVLGCDTRNRILARDLKNVITNDECKVMSGTLSDPYTGKVVQFVRGEQTSDDVQIDHVVALSNAWQTGAQALSYTERVTLANDPLNLLAVDGDANQQKSDGDAATWLPSNKLFRCQYVTRQINVKQKYNLWVTQAEHDAMERVLAKCPV